MNLNKILEFLNHDVKKEVDIYNQWIFELSKKESKIFEDTKVFIKQWNIGSYEEEYLRNFYYLQLLVELLNRFKKEMNISDNSINYLNTAYEDIKLAFRFLMLWYYNTSWIHLRWFFEKIIHVVIIHYIDIWRVSEIITTLNWKKEYFIKKTLEYKINECIKRWDFSVFNKENEWKDVYDKYYFPTKEVLKLYSHYSFDYVHDWNPTSDIKFDKLEFKRINLLLNLSHIFVWRFFKITIWESIEKYWWNKVLKQIEDYPYYWNYLQSFFWENKLLSNQFSYIYNIIHDDKDNTDFVFNILWLNKQNLFSKEYLDQINYHDKLWKKAKGNREKYWELYEKDIIIK